MMGSRHVKVYQSTQEALLAKMFPNKIISDKGGWIYLLKEDFSMILSIARKVFCPSDAKSDSGSLS